MTTVTRTMLLGKPLKTIWEFLIDTERVAKCLPGCQEVKVLDENKSRWKVKVNIGIISRIVETDAIRTTDSGRNQVAFKIRSTNGDLEGELRVQLFPLEEKTRLELNFDVKAVGAFSWVINQMVGKQSDKMAEQFAKCVEVSV